MNKVSKVAARAGRTSTRLRAKTAPAHAYHHGDLRNALLAATEALLEQAGVEAFTLREVARRAGVSHGAPAHHFHDVTGLLSAFSAQSFDQLADAMVARRASASAQPFEQLVASGVGYVDYALAHRARFQLMFRGDRLDHDHTELVQAAARAYGQLTECIGALAPPGSALAKRSAALTALAWSIVHGFSTLMIDNPSFAAQAGGDPHRALAQLETLIRLSKPAFTAPAHQRRKS